ncbi:MAG: tRNA epoxyqueuosine(34) reductase QueG [Ignavibacteriae bacterium]|nr:tRNA epoxyqueuosine(34) reductase QueG [Ignavibacteriota bacterium]
MLQSKIIEKANELGFDLIGFAKYETLEHEVGSLEDWLNNNYQAGMSYMDRNIEKRRDVTNILPNTKSVISLAMNYYVDEKFDAELPKVSRYAWGRDYHFTIWEKLDELSSYLSNNIPNFEAKTYTDTGPVMDKAWAVKSGLGWQGKHSNVISREIGSWFFIATILTNQEFETYNIPQQDFCGSCTACIDACPTDAIIQDYIVDANKCISYLTIENKNEISDKFIGKFDNWIFGCDICHEVCPWNNKFSQQTKISDFLDVRNKTLNFEDIEELSNRKFKQKFKESPLQRSKLKGLKRNWEFLKKSI